jgi:hypothetical protein
MAEVNTWQLLGRKAVRQVWLGRDEVGSIHRTEWSGEEWEDESAVRIETIN